MNIFYLDRDIVDCARYHNNKHVVKMILESAQVLSTVCRLYGHDAGYKPTHQNHPCTIWARKSRANWLWLRDLAEELEYEWQQRFGHTREHKSATVIRSLPVPDLPNPRVKCITHPAQAMPERYRHDDPVIAYRVYYMRDKRALADWGSRGQPSWWN